MKCYLGRRCLCYIAKTVCLFFACLPVSEFSLSHQRLCRLYFFPQMWAEHQRISKNSLLPTRLKPCLASLRKLFRPKPDLQLTIQQLLSVWAKIAFFLKCTVKFNPCSAEFCFGITMKRWCLFPFFSVKS